MRAKLLLPIALVALAVGVRVPHFHQRHGEIVSENEHVAVALASGRGWADPYGPDTGPTAHTAPVYPLLLAGVYRLCGDYQTEAGWCIQQILSIALTVLGLLLLPALSRKLGLSAVVGWGAAFAKACLVMDVEIKGEAENVLATLVFLGLLWCLADLKQRNWTGPAILRTGVLLGLAVLVYPNALFVGALFFLLELAQRSAPRARIVRCGLVVAALSLCLVTPWLVRNYRVLGGFVPLRSNLGLELAIGNRPGADGTDDDMETMHPLFRSHERVRCARLGELSYMRDKQRQALAWIVEHPGQFAALTARRIWLFYLPGYECWFGINCFSLQLHVPVFTLVLATAALALLHLLRQKPATGRLLVCAFLGAGLPYCVTHVVWRYRLPLQGLYLLLLGNLLAALVLALRNRFFVARASAAVPQLSPR